jgi:hypothetical protein
LCDIILLKVHTPPKDKTDDMKDSFYEELDGIFDKFPKYRMKILFFLLRGPSPQAKYTDRATAAVGEVVPTFAGRGCYVVSATDSHGR